MTAPQLDYLNKSNGELLTMDEQISVTSEVEDMTPDYLATIKELKQNSVDRQKYDQLKAENKRLLDSIVNGQELDLPKAEDKRSVEEIRSEMFKEDSGLTNLQYIQDALELRNALMSEGKPDPFLPVGNQITPTDFDIATAEKVSNVLQECVDEADGDSEWFTNELQRRTVDIPMPVNKSKKK